MGCTSDGSMFRLHDGEGQITTISTRLLPDAGIIHPALFMDNFPFSSDLTFPLAAPTPYVMLSFPPTTTKSSLNLAEELSSESAVKGRASIPSPLNS